MEHAYEMEFHRARMNAEDKRYEVELERMRPFYLTGAVVFPDGNKWCALFGENIQDGVAGFGDTPEAAARQFDVEWLNARSRR